MVYMASSELFESAPSDSAIVWSIQASTRNIPRRRPDAYRSPVLASSYTDTDANTDTNDRSHSPPCVADLELSADAKVVSQSCDARFQAEEPPAKLQNWLAILSPRSLWQRCRVLSKIARTGAWVLRGAGRGPGVEHPGRAGVVVPASLDDVAAGAVAGAVAGLEAGMSLARGKSGCFT